MPHFKGLDIGNVTHNHLNFIDLFWNKFEMLAHSMINLYSALVGVLSKHVCNMRRTRNIPPTNNPKKAHENA